MRFNGSSVEIMAMSECPNNCSHCFIRYKGHINFDDLDNMLSKYKAIYKTVILNGTELLMDDRYLDLCSKYKQDFIYTNGKLLTREKRLLLKEKGITRVSVSLHYGIQESISKFGIEEISNIIKETVADGIEVRVLCTLSKDNYTLVSEIANYVYSLGAKSIKFLNMLKEGQAEKLGDVFLNEEQIQDFFDILAETRRQYDKSDFVVTRNGFFGNDEKRENNFCCTAGIDSIIITPDHRVYPCNGLLYDEYCIGYWDESGIYIDKILKHSTKECLALKRQLK